MSESRPTVEPALLIQEEDFSQLDSTEEQELKTPVRPGKGVKRKCLSPLTPVGKQMPGDSDSVVSVKKRRKSASSTPRDQNRMGSPLLKPPLTERQQMALIMQMTDPQKHGAVFCMLLVFIAGVDKTALYGGCVLVSTLLHYFSLVSVCWMGGEAVLMFQKLVFVFKKVTTKSIVITSLVCWIAPLVPVLIPLIVELTPNFSELVIRTDRFCFLNNPVVFFVAFLGPILAIILFNMVVYIIVIVILIKHTRGTYQRKKESVSTKTIVRLMTSIAGIMFLFGLSWLFGALTVTVQELRLTFQVLFAIFTPLQGFFIFLFFCVLSQEARELWKETLSCGRYTSKFLNPSLKSSAGGTKSHKPKYSTGGTTSTSGNYYANKSTFKPASTSTGDEQYAEPPEKIDLGSKKGVFHDPESTSSEGGADIVIVETVIDDAGNGVVLAHGDLDAGNGIVLAAGDSDAGNGVILAGDLEGDLESIPEVEFGGIIKAEIEISGETEEVRVEFGIHNDSDQDSQYSI